MIKSKNPIENLVEMLHFKENIHVRYIWIYIRISIVGKRQNLRFSLKNTWNTIVSCKLKYHDKKKTQQILGHDISICNIIPLLKKKIHTKIIYLYI